MELNLFYFFRADAILIIAFSAHRKTLLNSCPKKNNEYRKILDCISMISFALLVENEPEKIALFQMLQRIQTKGKLSVECLWIEENYYYLQM